jgi:hypothetical protein
MRLRFYGAISQRSVAVSRQGRRVATVHILLPKVSPGAKSCLRPILCLVYAELPHRNPRGMLVVEGSRLETWALYGVWFSPHTPSCTCLVTKGPHFFTRVQNRASIWIEICIEWRKSLIRAEDGL